MNMYWPIALIVCSNIFYHITAKSTPENVNPMGSLVVTYGVGMVISIILYYALNREGNLLSEFSRLNWTAFALGIAIVGLELGNIYMYKVGWNINTGYIVHSAILAVALLAVGFLLYKEALTLTKLAGAAICMVGLYFINK